MANQLRPLVQIGKQGLTDSARRSVDQALEAHELVKVKFLDFQDQKAKLIDDLATATDSVLVHSIGNVAVLYRQQPDPDRRRIELDS